MKRAVNFVLYFLAGVQIGDILIWTAKLIWG